MSGDEKQGHTCEEIFSAILLSVDNELTDPATQSALNLHCAQCSPCGEIRTAHQEAVFWIKGILGDACREEASEELRKRLLAQTAALAAQLQAEEARFSSFTQTFTQTYTETAITIDGQMTIEISHIQEFREGF